MINITKKDLNPIFKYYNYKPTEDLVDRLVDELADILEKVSGLDIGIYQDWDEPTYYRIYAGCSAVEVFIENDAIQIDFDDSWTLCSTNNGYYSQGAMI